MRMLMRTNAVNGEEVETHLCEVYVCVCVCHLNIFDAEQ